MSIRVLQALDKVSGRGIPDPNALIERSGSNEAAIGRDGDGGNAIFDAEDEFLFAIDDIPEANGFVARARCDVATIAGEVERVDILLVA